VVTDVGVEGDFQAIEGRGVAINADESKVFVLTRTPDTLITVSVENPADLTGNLRVQIVGSVALPGGPNALSVISRAGLGLGDLIAITSTTANAVVLYDDQLGVIVADLPAVGVQPFGLAVDNRGSAARLYVTDYGDGRIAVIDIPDLTQPQNATVVAFLGMEQVCLVTPTDASCPASARQVPQ
jgi:DNA-binding beta-propeller fold protein YncE